MRKNLIIVIILFICGCSNNNKNNVRTIIEESESYIIAINFPITNSKLDKKINKEISHIYNDFKQEYKESTSKVELNIDYSFNHINRYINVVLYIYINDSSTIKNRVKTFVYDMEKNKILSISDITDETDIIDSFVGKNSNYSFIFDKDNLTLFISNDKEYEDIHIPLKDLNLKIDITQQEILKTVNVTIPEKIIDPNSKMIALTFDDGPSKYTDDILEVLKEKKCNATFFILGNKVSIYSDTLIKSINNGNELGNHSYNHKLLVKLNEQEILEQINKTQSLLKEYIGYTPTIIRPTYGSLNNTIKKVSNLDIVLWNVDTMDWKYKNPERIVKNATKNLKDGNIILMHDTYQQTLESLPKIIDIIKKEGYECVTVSELKEAQLIRKRLNE